VATLFATANTEIMTEISAALGNNAAVKQILHIGDDGGIASTRVAVYDADGTASYLYLGTNSVSVNDGTDNLMLIDGSAKTVLFAVGQAAADDFIVEDTAGTDIIVIEGDNKSFTFTGDGTANSDLTFNDGTDDLMDIQGGTAKKVIFKVAVASGDDFSVVDTAETAMVLFEGDTKTYTFTGDASANSNFVISDGTNDLFKLETETGDITIKDGAYDFDIAAHDGTNGLLLGGVLLAASSTEMNEVCDMSTHVVAPATGDLTMTAALHGNRVLYYNDADGTITLPAATGTGYTYLVVLKTAATAATIQAASASDSFLGGISGVDGDADTAIAYSADPADDTISLNGTSTGGIVGDWYMFIDVATGLFLVDGYAHHSGGSEASCFSAAVS